MLLWEQIKLMVEKDEIGYFYRSEESKLKYYKLKEKCQKEGITLYQNLVVHSLNWYTHKEGVPLGKNGLPDDKDIIVKELNPTLFADPSDYKFLVNEYGYDFPKNLIHLCLWFKNFMVPDPKSDVGDISIETKHVIERGLQNLLEPVGVKRDQYVWFKNWAALQSIRLLSHVHVVIVDLTSEQLAQILAL
ncbi:uncharacterized protein KQ657_001198 [Scheffersomyces spartinae]|uniref:Uncharacterized protein n=1 Tax=Scheffersomyces spartinae TaxID=45513 RepID=A0A9P7V8B3_9ASCO|nr:uncharacterized protein KQ657_001198 [Scheffersomyces spartinae]KAG7193081.1 hypothetical protein KQ657_001198 [Scheffersomyces spartinae]